MLGFLYELQPTTKLRCSVHWVDLWSLGAKFSGIPTYQSTAQPAFGSMRCHCQDRWRQLSWRPGGWPSGCIKLYTTRCQNSSHFHSSPILSAAWSFIHCNSWFTNASLSIWHADTPCEQVTMWTVFTEHYCIWGLWPAGCLAILIFLQSQTYRQIWSSSSMVYSLWAASIHW